MRIKWLGHASRNAKSEIYKYFDRIIWRKRERQWEDGPDIKTECGNED
jgi:hypothetical protein